jgi:hypothetical protein
LTIVPVLGVLGAGTTTLRIRHREGGSRAPSLCDRRVRRARVRRVRRAISPGSAIAVFPGRLSSASLGQLRTEAPDGGPAVPAGGVFDEVLTGVSCNQVDKTSFCSAVGYHAGSGSVFGLNEDAQNGKWLSDPVFGSVG